MIEVFHSIFYWLNARTWISVITLLVTSRDIRGLERVPRHGAVILTSNHFSSGDPPILVAMIPRRIVWMAKQELFDAPGVGLLYYMGGFIPVRRSEADLRALRRCQQALRRGQMLGMFPEGTRSGGRLGKGEPGTALIALRTGAPILPVAIWGTETVKLPRSLFARTRVHIRVGEPYQLSRSSKPTKEQIASGTDEIMRRIAELLPQQYHGDYATKSEALMDGAREAVR